jgi:hypothetical protein
MDQVVTAAPEGGAGIALPVAPITPAAEGTFSTREAAQNLAKARWAKRQESEAPAAPEPAAAEPEPVSTPEVEAAPPQEAPGEPTVAPEPAPPPIEPPRSWTKEEKAEFATYPREAQEKIARREQEREAAIRRGQNEVAEKAKAAEAERQQLIQARQQYEAQLPALMQILQHQTQAEFSDIKTPADVAALARTDPARYLLLDAHQKQVAAVQQEQRAAQERQAKEQETRITEFAKREDAAILEHIPELADPDKAKKLTADAAAILSDVGFTSEELSESYNGRLGISLRDHRMQRILFESMKYREAKAKAAKPAERPVPPVQRPGVAQPSGAAAQASIQALSTKLETSGSAKDAAKLVAERRALAGRRKG